MESKSFNKKGIEDKLKYLEEFVAKVHEALSLHKWIKDYRPWNAIPPRERKTHKCNQYCDHHEYYIWCECGESRKATDDEYAKAEAHYDGY